MNTDKDKKSF